MKGILNYIWYVYDTEMSFSYIKLWRQQKKKKKKKKKKNTFSIVTLMSRNFLTVQCIAPVVLCENRQLTTKTVECATPGWSKADPKFSAL